MNRLNQVGLWPASNLLQTASLEDVSASISLLGICLTVRGTCPCSTIKASLEQAVDYAKSQQQGLCLKCVGEGRVTKKGGNCLAALPHLCTSLEQANSRCFYRFKLMATYALQ